MAITNSELKRSAAQVFAYGLDIQVPFYNREKSKKEILDRFEDDLNSRGLVYFISAPLGTGKTFFIDHVSSELEGIQTRQRPLFARELKSGEIRGFKGKIIYIDEADIKSTWNDLRNAMDVVKAHTEKTGQKAIVLGDYTLRNNNIVGDLENTEYLRSFEPLDKEFLAGVLDQRVHHFLNKKGGASIISDELYDVLTPSGLAAIATFRTVLTMLSQFTQQLPYNSKQCVIDLELAKKWVEENFDPLLTTDNQNDFLNVLLDFIMEQHPKGAGMNEGLSEDQLFALGRDLGYESIENFRDEILVPFAKNELLVSTGVPFLDGKGEFVRWPEPYLPTIQTLLLAEL